MVSSPWLLLLHQIPPKPAYFRAQTLRRLTQVGALPVKNSAYLLPENDDTLEDFQWICREIAEQGGSAWLFRAEALTGLTEDDIRQAFRNLRAPDYRQLIEDGRALLAQLDFGSPEAQSAFAKLARRAQTVRSIDFFDAPEFKTLEEIMKEIERHLQAGKTEARREGPGDQHGRVWVTRKGVKVDRIGSAWLIRRFIDPEASFRFIDPNDYKLQKGEIRFDMFEGEFSHEGDMCTFEVLAGFNRLSDPAIKAVAEIVHDIDLKEQRYGRPETAGFSRLVEGVCLRTADDEMRIERGAALFDALYESFHAGNSV